MRAGVVLVFGIFVASVVEAQPPGLGPYGDKHWRAPVTNVSSLPATGNAVNDARLTVAVETVGGVTCPCIAWWDGSAPWNLIGGGVGPQGPQGDTGPAGADGAAGPTGADGAQGPQGNPGPAGADGSDGADALPKYTAEEGSQLTQRDTLNFVGSLMTCADNSGNARTDCTVTDDGLVRLAGRSAGQIIYGSSAGDGYLGGVKLVADADDSTGPSFTLQAGGSPPSWPTAELVLGTVPLTITDSGYYSEWKFGDGVHDTEVDFGMPHASDNMIFYVGAAWMRFLGGQIELHGTNTISTASAYAGAATMGGSANSADALSAQYIDWSASFGGSSIANKPTLFTASDVPAAETDAAHDTAAEVGAVSLQGTTPGSAQTGNINITGTVIASTGVVTPAVAAPVGSTMAVSATAPAATTGASQAGKTATFTASNAIASTDTPGAAAGGSATITGGNAARNASGDANGGDVNLNPGAAVGNGTHGMVKSSRRVQFGGVTGAWIDGAAGPGLDLASYLALDSSFARIKSTMALCWASSSIYNGCDAYIYRGAANVIDLRNGTNGQSFRIFGSYSDASNYVRLTISCTSTSCTIAPETGGTGADNVPVALNAVGNEAVTIAGCKRWGLLASPPVACDATVECAEYSDTSHAKCYCDGTTWLVLGGAGTCV
jgi:hypothetical protein